MNFSRAKIAASAAASCPFCLPRARRLPRLASLSALILSAMVALPGHVHAAEAPIVQTVTYTDGQVNSTAYIALTSNDYLTLSIS